MKVSVNEEIHELEKGSSLLDLLLLLGLDGKKGLALSLNDSVVPRADFPHSELVEGDRVLLIHATQGG